MNAKKYFLNILFQIETMLTTDKTARDIIEYIELKKEEIEKLTDKEENYMNELIDNLK